MFKYNNLSIILRIFILLPFLFQTVLCDTLDAEKLDNSEAIFNLGLSYYNGKGFEQNYAKAVEYFEKAEKLGYTKAMLQLSNCYLFGFGVVKNLTKSVEYYEKASNLHDTEKTSAYYFASAYHQNGNDMDYIGDCYYFGINGYEQNYEKAFEYFQKAAKLNNSHSINRLAESFYEGIGVVKNVTKAYEYYKQSAELNDTFAIYKLGVAYYLGTEIEQNNTKSYEYFLRGSELNNSDSCVYLGTFYMDDRIGKKNLAKAIECFSKSVFIEKAFSYQTLGNMYWSSVDYHDAGVYKSIEGLLSVFSNSFGCNFHTKINEQISKKFEYYDKSV